MLSRLLQLGAGKRLDRAVRSIDELESLRSRVTEIESSLKARAETELVLLRRLTDSRVRFELTRHRLSNVTAQVAEYERKLERERDRADSAERRLADMTSGRADAHAELEREHARRALAEQTAQRLQGRDAEIEERLLALTEGLERAVSTLSTRIAARRDAYEQLAPSLTHVTERVKLLLQQRATPRRAPVREDQHLRFYTVGGGYELVVADGPPPAPNAVVDCAEHGPGVVVKLGRSPLPADDRRCAYLLPCTGSSERPHDESGVRGVRPLVERPHLHARS